MQLRQLSRSTVPHAFRSTIQSKKTARARPFGLVQNELFHEVNKDVPAPRKSSALRIIGYAAVEVRKGRDIGRSGDDLNFEQHRLAQLCQETVIMALPQCAGLVFACCICFDTTSTPTRQDAVRMLAIP